MLAGFISKGVTRRAAEMQPARVLIGALVGVAALATSGGAFAAGCTGPGAPAPGSPVICMTAIAIPGNPLTSFDISWVDTTRGEYYLGDRSNAGIDIIDTATNTFKRTIGGFVGCPTNSANKCITSKSGPDGVVSHGRWLYGGDGDSTLKVIDLNAAGTTLDPSIKQSISTGGSTRVDEMAVTTDGTMLLAANNAEDPPFATLFQANGDNTTSAVSIISKINVDPSLIPAGLGLSLEQPTWDPGTRRFYVSIPQINYPAGCTPGAADNPGQGIVGCQGGLLVIDPSGVTTPTYTYGAYVHYTNVATNTGNIGVLALPTCAPNGAVVGPATDSIGANLLLGCTPANNASNKGTLAINTTTMNYTTIGNITGSDEVSFNAGDNKYFTGSSANRADLQGPVLGIIDAKSNIMVSIIPQGSGSHSVAADSAHNFIYVPQVVPVNPSGPPGAGGGDTTGNSAGICGTSNGCVAVYFDQSPTID